MTSATNQRGKPNYWYALYNDDYSKMTIKREGCVDEELHLRDGIELSLSVDIDIEDD